MIRPQSVLPGFAAQIIAVTTFLLVVSAVGVWAGSPQTINFTAPLPPISSTFGNSFNFAAVSVQSPSAQISFSGGGSCTITDNGDGTGSALMTSGIGQCTVIAQAPGDSILNPGLQTKFVNALKKAQTITVTTPAPGAQPFNPAAGTDFTVDATSDSGLDVTIKATGSCTGGPALNTLNVEMTSGSGNCATAFSQPGDNDYLAAATINEVTTAQKAAQVITRCGTPCAPATLAYGSTFVATATSSSGLPVAITNTGVCMRAGNTTRMTSGGGACTTKYNQAGNANFLTAPQILEITNAIRPIRPSMLCNRLLRTQRTTPHSQ